MSSRSLKSIKSLSALAFFVLLVASGTVIAQSGSESGIDVYSGGLDMHGNNISDAVLGDSVDGTYLSWSDLGISQSDVSNSDVGLGNIENKDVTGGSGEDLELTSGDYIRFVAGSGSGTCSIDTDGTISCTGSKNWIHDINSTHEAFYSSQESPEVRAVYEGQAQIENGEVNVTLPSHFSKTVSDSKPMLRVQATPHELAQVAVTERTDDFVVVEASTDVQVDFRVTGIREGYEDKEVVRRK